MYLYSYRIIDQVNFTLLGSDGKQLFLLHWSSKWRCLAKHVGAKGSFIYSKVNISNLTSSTKLLILSKKPIAPLYFSFTAARVVKTFHFLAWDPIASWSRRKFTTTTQPFFAYHLWLCLCKSLLVQPSLSCHRQAGIWSRAEENKVGTS